jgi:hypothetical protein
MFSDIDFILRWTTLYWWKRDNIFIQSKPIFSFNLLRWRYLLIYLKIINFISLKSISLIHKNKPLILIQFIYSSLLISFGLWSSVIFIDLSFSRISTINLNISRFCHRWTNDKILLLTISLSCIHFSCNKFSSSWRIIHGSISFIRITGWSSERI